MGTSFSRAFPGHYKPTEEEFSQMWQKGIFFFDTNVLLKLYNYSTETRDELLSIMVQENFNRRVKLSFRVAEEFHRHRIDRIFEIAEAYEEIKNIATNKSNEFSGTVKQKYSIHPYIDIGKLEGIYNSAAEDVVKAIEVAEKSHTDLVSNDPIYEAISNIFDKKVISHFYDTAKSKSLSEGEDRYEKRIPPGYMDARDKDDERKFGDLIIWNELLEFSKSANSSRGNIEYIVFVTDDKKEDWWLKRDGRVLGPRIELIKEMLEFANCKFYMYSTQNFMKYAQVYLSSNVQTKSLTEIADVTAKYNERSQNISQKTSKIAPKIPPLSTLRQFYKFGRDYRKYYPITDPTRLSLNELYINRFTTFIQRRIARNQDFLSTEMQRYYAIFEEDIAHNIIPDLESEIIIEREVEKIFNAVRSEIRILKTIRKEKENQPDVQAPEDSENDDSAEIISSLDVDGQDYTD